jgi:hypothetical protein
MEAYLFGCPSRTHPIVDSLLSRFGAISPLISDRPFATINSESVHRTVTLVHVVGSRQRELTRPYIHVPDAMYSNRPTLAVADSRIVRLIATLLAIGLLVLGSIGAPLLGGAGADAGYYVADQTGGDTQFGTLVGTAAGTTVGVAAGGAIAAASSGGVGTPAGMAAGGSIGGAWGAA